MPVELHIAVFPLLFDCQGKSPLIPVKSLAKIVTKRHPPGFSIFQKNG
jgi:hypothetical protein